MGGQTLKALLGHATLKVGDFPAMEITLGFVRDWKFAHAGVLGQRGFFDRFGVFFDRVNQRFAVLSQDEVDATFPPPLAR